MSKLSPEALPEHRALAVEAISRAVAIRTINNPMQRQAAEALCMMLGIDLEAAERGDVLIKRSSKGIV